MCCRARWWRRSRFRCRHPVQSRRGWRTCIPGQPWRSRSARQDRRAAAGCGWWGSGRQPSRSSRAAARPGDGWSARRPPPRRRRPRWLRRWWEPSAVSGSAGRGYVAISHRLTWTPVLGRSGPGSGFRLRAEFCGNQDPNVGTCRHWPALLPYPVSLRRTVVV